MGMKSSAVYNIDYHIAKAMQRAGKKGIDQY
jgi:hypothetical protein